MNIIEKFEHFVYLLKESNYDSDKLYCYEAIVSRLKKGPGYIKQYIDKLPKIECIDLSGNKHICTQIPEVIFNYIFHRNF